MSQVSFIETQFPVSKVSKESYKERKANNGQTLTGLGKWWGRKPLVLVRAAILGCLLPTTDNPTKDMEVFLKLMSMDEEGLLLRKEKKFSLADLYEIIMSNHKLKAKYGDWFDLSSGKPKLDRGAPRDDIEAAAFKTLGYDAKIVMCKRPEQLENISEQAWTEINHHLGTSAHSLQELVRELSVKQYGHNVVIGDCFCGGGSIPFEAARIGCDTYASDLNPIAGLLTWADMHLCGTSEKDLAAIMTAREKIYNAVDEKIKLLGIEENEKGDRAISYVYCVEAKCPECGTIVPLAPSWVIGKGTKTVAKLIKNGNKYDFEVKSGATATELKEASSGTVGSQGMICPCCGKSTPISALRHDIQEKSEKTVSGLRLWEREDFEARKEDVYHERLYAIKYEDASGKRYYRAPEGRDLENEDKVHKIVSENFCDWQKQGLIPSMQIESGYNTDQLIRERGWTYWHHLFNVRQLLVLSMLLKEVSMLEVREEKIAGLLGLHKCIDWDSKICRWHSGAGNEKSEQTYYNQALNTMMNYGTRSLNGLKTAWFYDINQYEINTDSEVVLADARAVNYNSNIWITDPPYADAVNYHELSEYFLAWDKRILQSAFPEWYVDSKRILAVRGDEHFSQTMIEIYSNLTKHMPDNGMQIVMFTHSDPAVWAQLAVIMWKAGLKVTAAWNIATETDASGLKNGNYVKGTVLLVLRKQTGDDMAFLDEINADIRNEVKQQIETMQKLDDKEEPNFSDPDYVLAAYAASLKVLTSYASIEDLDLDYELKQAISKPSGSQIVTIIENAKKIAFDCVIPVEFDSFLWRELTNAEKFYIKGLESEKHGNYQISTYQEFARGFSIGGYSQMMASERANTARLKTPFEMAGRTISDVPDFEHSLMRTIFGGIYTGIKEDNNPNKALGFIKNDLADYWGKREMIQHILSFLIDIQDISNMQPHWTESSRMAELLLAMVAHDSI